MTVKFAEISDARVAVAAAPEAGDFGGGIGVDRAIVLGEAGLPAFALQKLLELRQPRRVLARAG